MSEDITIRVKSMDDRVETIPIKLTDMVNILREKVHAKFGKGSVVWWEIDIPIEEITLLFRGRVLKDDKTVESYKVERDNTILLVRRRRQENGVFVPALWRVEGNGSSAQQHAEQQGQNQRSNSLDSHMTALFFFIHDSNIQENDLWSYACTAWKSSNGWPGG